MRTIIVTSDDLIFKTRIDTILQALNLSADKYNYFYDFDFDSLNAKKSLVIVDLENDKLGFCKINKLKKAFGGKVYLLGYCSHVKNNLMLTALDAGFDEVIVRSKFVKTLPDFLKSFDKLAK